MTCTTCGRDLPPAAFSQREGSPVQPCRECACVYRRAWHLHNRTQPRLIARMGYAAWAAAYPDQAAERKQRQTARRTCDACPLETVPELCPAACPRIPVNRKNP